MKLLGAIALLAVLAVGCQKENIQPANADATSGYTYRSGNDPTIEGGVTTDSNPADGGGITDPNDQTRSNKTPKPKQPN